MCGENSIDGPCNGPESSWHVIENGHLFLMEVEKMVDMEAREASNNMSIGLERNMGLIVG